ncbi:hypothetical protein HOV56_gp35 [Nitrosopumilus spindle-shaped virus]|uniref:Uncharacterized protein n=1 Tax=Nitrosopumilus spindle-shaped virus TaxID=2508184 RepID=A0A514K4B2_9VIRU|nr:hypothetical protein HOV56_gp35 [Nitrosopumilus spindle-shaped virus]YP_010772864.1 hypothetical protein QIT54_gp34 [Nitrosopumilus spindle-shaped virus]QDI73924.1 hypothetical protein [Nitrosopumilus spindle-shaped virus]QDI73972.1 hypothetical protein [Nitrosopumilus spindle-shaped virus]
MICSTCNMDKHILIPVKMENEKIEELEICIICFKKHILGVEV